MHFIKKILCKSECAEKGFQSRYNMLTRIVSLVMLFIMLPISIPDAAAAMEYRYVYLISKPTFRYTYNDDGMWALDTSTDKGVRMEKQGSYWVCTDYIPVTTQYTNETTPTLDLWDGTKFSYTGEAYPYDQDLAPIDDNTYYFAGNIRGGSSCEIATSEEQRDSFAGDGSPVADIEAPSRFNSGSTTYYIKPQISVSEAKKGNRLQTSNVSVFLFKSTKTLPGVYDPPESNVQADLEISTNNVYMNYKEFDVDGYVSTQVTFDPTGSTSTLDWDSYGMDGYSSKSDWNVSDSWNGPPEQQQFEVKYSKSDLGFNGFPGSVTDYISGEVVVSDGEKSDSASDESSVRLQFYNDGPMAIISSIKSTNLTSIGSSYDSTFYYVGEPIQITDASYDPENRQYDSYTDDPVVNYWVKYNGNNILVVNGMNASGVDYLDSYVESATVNGSAITATFKKAGYYTIGVQIQDEVGSWNETTKTIKVSGDPQPPTAIINSGNYTFVDYPLNVSDSSTDPNNDIVTWTWGKITSIDEEGNEVAANGVSGSLKGGTLPAGSTSKPSGIGGTLTFGAPGEYDIHLTVTDATKLSDEAVKTVKVIRDIPVAEIEPGPESSDNPSDSDPHYALDPEDELEKVYVKQNRKVELDASNSLSPPASPIQWEKTEWIYDASDTDPEFDLTTVNVDSSSTVKKQVFLAKEVGEFKITLTLHNEYSDALPDTDPDLAARTKTIIVKVLPDEPPVSTIQVDNMNPNFHDNPASVNVKVVATGKSLDNDFIDYYNWSLYRDNNNDGVYDSSTEELTNRKGTNSTEITIPVKFESGNTSTFLGKVEAYERFGQETIDKFITADDNRMSSSEMEFEVNWRPCISYTMREFAYVDDTLTITPVLKDENVETCTVEWTLMKKNSAGEYEAIDPASVEANVFGDKPVWELGLHGGTIRITKDGYYRLDAVITDAEGHSEQFSSTEIRIYDMPHAVISDNADYRWLSQTFQFKESRKFTLDGNASYVDDSTGAAKHQLNRSLDEWTITPLDGQDAGQIYVGTTADGTAKLSSTESTRFNPGRNSFDEVLAILEPGRYRVDYQVTNTYGKKSAVTTQEIVIIEDTAPIIEGVVQSTVLRGSAENNAETVISIGDLNIYSDDQDIINTNWTIELIHDKDNDGFQNDSWQTVNSKYIDISRDERYHVTMNITIPESNLGAYQFKVYDKDIFDQETLPIVPESERKETTKTFDTEVDNVKPNGTFSTRSEAKGDVVFAIGNSQAGTEVQNATLTFENRFGSEAGMDVMDVNVETVETSSIDSQTSFPWEVYNLYMTGFGAPNNPGDGQFSPSGNSYYYRGYGSEAPIDHLYYDDGRSGSREFTFDIDMTGYNSCATVIPGFIFGAHLDEDTNVFSGYMVLMWHNIFGVYSFTSTDGHRGLASNGIGNIATSYAKNDYASGAVSFKLLDSHATVSQSLQKSVKMKYENGVLTITDSGVNILEKKYESKYNGYGIVAANSGHGCGARSYTRFNNFSLQTTSFKTLNDALSDVSWRDGAERFVIYVDDDVQDYMTPGLDSKDPSSYANLLSSLLDSNIHLIALGSATNENQLKSLLNQLNESGMYYRNIPASTALDASEEFIKQILRNEARDTMYVLVNERLNYNKIYNDFNGDPQWLWTADGNTPYLAIGAEGYDELFQQFQDNPSILAQKWKYWHDADYYDNSQGIASFDQEWMTHEVNVFDKVGMYEIDYRIKDNPVPDKSDNSTGNPFDEYRYWSSDYAADATDSNGYITNPHAVVYVHRRPLAEFDFVAKKVNDIVDEVDITSNAYDLDHQYSDKNLGLNLFEWSWKFASDSNWRGNATFSSAAEGEQWINSQLVGLRNLGMDNIIVQYRVRDIDGPAEEETLNVTHKVGSGWVTSEETAVRNQGVWSLPAVRWITSKGLPPVARFDTNNTVFGLGEKITVTDRSYSPNGDNIVQWQWTVERSTGTKTTVTYSLNSNGITSVDKMEDQFSNYLTNWIDSQPIGTKSKDNEYKITLIVADDKPKKMTSDPYSVTVKITPENTAPTVDPNNPPDTDASMFAHDNPIVYEYDAYDANLTNPYYKYKGTVQYRGTETIDWSVALDDPDNHDKYGTGNDSGSYKLSFTLDRFLAVHRTDVAEGATGAQRINYPTKTVTSAQAAVSSNIAPFTSVQNGNVGWGAWRITTSVTDVPNNDSTPKTTEMVTHAAEKPLHLYVIPKLDVAAPHFSYDGVQDNQTQIPTGEVVTITTTTNDRSTGAKILYKDGDGSALEQEMVLVKTEGETKYWSADFVIPDNLEAEDLISGEYYPYQVETYTNYGSQAGEVTRAKAVDGAANIHILPIKLYDFTITGITDPSVVFGGDTTVRDLAYDRANSENGALMKLGYAFNFKVYSKGMKDSDDYVRIRPTFWGYNNATGRYDMPLDVYYLNDNDEYVLATTNPDNSAASGDDFTIKTQEFFGKTIGSIRELKLTSNFRDAADRNTQVWSARYGLPGTAVFVGKGGSLTETNMYLGDVLINFDIEAMKHGSAKYNYIGKGQWRIERTDGNGNFLNPDKTKYEDGDIILLDGMNNAALDFESRPVWTKLQ